MYLFRLMGQAAGTGVASPIIPDSLQGVGYAALGIFLYLLQRRGTSIIVRDEAKDAEDAEVRKADRVEQTSREQQLQKKLDDAMAKSSQGYEELLAQTREELKAERAAHKETAGKLAGALQDLVAERTTSAHLLKDNARLRRQRSEYRAAATAGRRIAKDLELRQAERQLGEEISSADEALSTPGLSMLANDDSDGF